MKFWTMLFALATLGVAVLVAICLPGFELAQTVAFISALLLILGLVLRRTR